jgi:hypothetical protein
MGCCTEPDAKAYLMDDSVITKFNRNAHYWFGDDSLKKLKAKVAQ